MTSLCDTCTNPGRCCAGFDLPIARGETALHVLVELASVNHGMVRGIPVRLGSLHLGEGSKDVEHAQLGLPFMPLMKQPSGFWRLWCPLLVDGRCSDYENRPALCRHFEPGSDKLCCMTVPEGSEPTAAVA